MSNTNLTTPLVWPSQNDLNGGTANDGKRMLEKYARQLFLASNGISYVISGGLLPSTAADRNLIIPAGIAYISGLYVTWASTTVALPASSTSHIFIKLNFVASIVAAGTGAQAEDNVTGIHPADSIKLGTVVTSGTAITSSTDQRLLDGNQRIRRVVISATGTTNWIVPANVTRVRLRQWGASGGGGGGGGGDGSASGGDAAAGQAAGYWEAVMSVTPGATVTVVNGVGGSPGGGGAFNVSGGSDGSDGGNGGTSSVAGTGFNFSASGGVGGAHGLGAPSGGPSQGHTSFRPDPSGASASSGTLDISVKGGGQQGAKAGNGSTGNGSAGEAGTNARTIIDY